MAHTFYIDESGHAGINYLDSQQPFHVAAGVLIDNADRIVLDVTIKSLLVQGQEEIKGSQLMRSSRGQRRILDLLKNIGQAHVMPFFVIMERRFSIAGKIVDVFLDPAHQDDVDWLPTSALEQRQKIAEHLFDHLAEETLNDFARAYRMPTVDGFTTVLTQIVDKLHGEVDKQLRRAFQGALRHVAGIVASETYGDAETKHGDWAGLNVPAFAHILRNVDQCMDDLGGKFDIVHDAALQYEAAFRRVLAMIAQPSAPFVDLQLPDGTLIRGIYRNFGVFRTANSAEEPGVQAADILAAAVAGVAKAAINPSSAWTSELHQIARFVLPPLLMTDEERLPHFGGISGHERTKLALLRSLFQKSKEHQGEADDERE